MGLGDIWDQVRQKPTVRTVSVRLPESSVLDEGFAPVVVEPNGAYFQIRLCEMFLRHQRELWRMFVPSTLFLCDFKYDTNRVQVPFFVSNQLLSGLGANAPGLDKMRVRFRDTRVVGPVPYLGDEVGVFVGLFRTQTGDLRKSLFAVFEKLFGAFDIANLRQYIAMADKLSAEVLECFGMKDVECLLAERNVYGNAGASNEPLRDTYFAMINEAESKVDISSLRVRDSTLWQARGDQIVPYEESDYCLLRVERLAYRNDYTTLPFHKTWEKARRQLVARRETEAEFSRQECLQQILESSDLTEDHKNKLVIYYQANYQRDRETFLAPASPAAEPEARGGEADDAMDAGSALARIKERAREKGADRLGIKGIDAIKSLVDANRKSGITHAPDTPFRNEDIVQQLEFLQAQGPSQVSNLTSAAALVRALASGTLA